MQPLRLFDSLTQRIFSAKPVGINQITNLIATGKFYRLHLVIKSASNTTNEIPTAPDRLHILTNCPRTFLTCSTFPYDFQYIGAINTHVIRGRSVCRKGHAVRFSHEPVRKLSKQNEAEKKQKSSDKSVMVTTDGNIAVVKKISLKQRIISELLHYYHGFKLLLYDIIIAGKLLITLARGNKLTRREKKQLVRTCADLFRMIPFLVIIIVPFMEFLLPAILKLFPNMLPSTFIQEDKQREKMRKELKMKIEIAKFLQDTLEDMAHERTGVKAEEVTEFTNFIAKIRKSGEMVSNEEILRFSKLFENDITLDNMKPQQLKAVSRMLDLPFIEMSPNILRSQLKLRLRSLEADDKLIRAEGLDNMTTWELQDACRERGMRTYGLPMSSLREQLEMWQQLHLDKKIPTSLLLLTRSLYMNENITVPVPEQVKEAITALQPQAVEIAKSKISEESKQHTVDNKAKLQEVKEEQAIIRAEKQVKANEVISQLNRDTETGVQTFMALMKWKNRRKTDKKALTMIDLVKPAGVSEQDLDEVDVLLGQLVQAQANKHFEQEQLKNLKDSVEEYLATVGEVRDVVDMKDEVMKGLDRKESAAARALGRKVGFVIHKVDHHIQTLQNIHNACLKDLKELQEDVVLDEVKADVDLHANMLEMMEERKLEVESIDELLSSLLRIKAVIHDRAKAEEVMRILDNDQEGKIDLNETIMMVDVIGSGNHGNQKFARAQMQLVADVLQKEAIIKGCERTERLRQRQFELEERQRKLEETQLGLLRFISAQGQELALLRVDEKFIRHEVEGESSAIAELGDVGSRPVNVDAFPDENAEEAHADHDRDKNSQNQVDREQHRKENI